MEDKSQITNPGTWANRRCFLKGGLASAVAALQIDTPLEAQPAPAVAAGKADVVVIGAGAFGAWTALTLRERGFKVVLVDAYGPANPRASSCDETRQIRCGYGDQEIYSVWAKKAMGLWETREREWKQKFLYPSGRLQLAPHWTAELEAERKIFDRLSIKYEIIKHDELRHRYPQVNFEGVESGFFEPRTALIKAHDALLRVAQTFEQKGGTLHIAQAAPGRASGRRLETVTLGTAESISAGTFVFACGPWMRKLFPDLLGKKIATPRAEVIYVGPPPGDLRFSWPNFPNLTGAGLIVYPCIDRGVKLLPGGEGEADPDSQERIVSAAQVKRSRDYIALRLPGLKDQPIVETHVCQYEMTADRNFIIDMHPEFENVWLAGGGSGHGFKHGPVLGEYIADRVKGIPPDQESRKTFALAGRQDSRLRSGGS